MKKWYRRFISSSISTKLIIVNLAVFVLQSLTYIAFWLFQQEQEIVEMLRVFYLPLDYLVLHAHIHTLFSFQFFHDPESIGHILMNMLTLFFTAPLFYQYMPEKRILPLYLAGGIAGALFTILFYNIFPAFNLLAGISYLYGASASIMAILFAATAFNPNYEVFVFNVFRAKILYIALFVLFVEIFSITSGNHGGHLSHIGGALFGYVYIALLRKGFNLLTPLEKVIDWIVTYLKWPFAQEKEIRLVYTKYTRQVEETKTETPSNNHSQEVIDRILDKISRSGYDSLSKDEKETLSGFSK